MAKSCPNCGESINAWEARCTRCSSHRPHRKKAIREKACQRCGKTFEPRSNYFRICDNCIEKKYVKLRQEYIAVDNAANPCDTCTFEKRCKALIHDPQFWPLCWAESPEHQTFLQAYKEQVGMQGIMARSLVSSGERVGK